MVLIGKSNISHPEIDFMWRLLSTKQKKIYSDLLKQMKKIYVTEFEKFVRVNC